MDKKELEQAVQILKEDVTKDYDSIHFRQSLDLDEISKIDSELAKEYERLSNIMRRRFVYVENLKNSLNYFDRKSSKRDELLHKLKTISRKSDDEITNDEWNFLGSEEVYWIRELCWAREVICGERPDLRDGYILENTGTTYNKYQQIVDVYAEISNTIDALFLRAENISIPTSMMPGKIATDERKKLEQLVQILEETLTKVNDYDSYVNVDISEFEYDGNTFEIQRIAKGLYGKYLKLKDIVTNRVFYALRLKESVDNLDRAASKRDELLHKLKTIAQKSDAEITNEEWKFLGSEEVYYIEQLGVYEWKKLGERPDLRDGYILENLGTTYNKYQQIDGVYAEISDVIGALFLRAEKNSISIPIYDPYEYEYEYEYDVYEYDEYDSEEDGALEEITEMAEEMGITGEETEEVGQYLEGPEITSQNKGDI